MHVVERDEKQAKGARGTAMGATQRKEYQTRERILEEQNEEAGGTSESRLRVTKMTTRLERETGLG